MSKEYIKEVYKNSKEEIEVKVDLDYESVWLNREQLSNLFDKFEQTISYYLKDNIKAVSRIFRHTGTDGKNYSVKHYSLEVIEKIGYKINVEITKDFINWSNNLLNELRNENAKKWLPIEVFEDEM